MYRKEVKNMQLNDEKLNALKEVINAYEKQHGALSEVRVTSNNCTDCYSNGGCKGNCKNTCKSTCGYYGSRY